MRLPTRPKKINTNAKIAPTVVACRVGYFDWSRKNWCWELLRLLLIVQSFMMITRRIQIIRENADNRGVDNDN